MPITDIIDWVRDDLSKFADEDHFDILRKTNEIVIRVFSDVNQYTITATPELVSSKGGSRKPRAGETWSRARDMSSGPLERATWEQIKNDIISFELVRLAKKPGLSGPHRS